MVSEIGSGQDLVEIAAQWASGLANAGDVVDVATDALVAGLESPSLILLASTPKAQADTEVHDLLERTMEELDLPFFGWHDPRSEVLAAAPLARRHLDHQLSARDLCRMIHSRFGHETHDLIEPLSDLDDCFDVLEYSPNPTEEEDLERWASAAAIELVAYADHLFTQR